MKVGVPWRALKLVIRYTCFLPIVSLVADQVPVRYLEGRVHGFLALRDAGDKLLASGTLDQVATAGRVTTELHLQFKDGSLLHESTVYSQRRAFKLLNYHSVQKGPAFGRTLDLTVNASTGQVTVKHTDDGGKEKTINERMDLPADLANGMVSTMLVHLDPKLTKAEVSMLVATPKPQLVKLEITPAGEDAFSVGGSGSKAARYAVKVNIGGIKGVIAPLVGKQPPDTYIWVVRGKAPGFLKSEGPLFQDGPIWQIELASPVWPQASREQKK